MQIAALLPAGALWLALATVASSAATAAAAPQDGPPAEPEQPKKPMSPSSSSPAASPPPSPPPPSSPASSVPSGSGGPLTEAEAALRAGIHKKCVDLAQQALATGQLDEDGVARAWWTRGRCHSIDGDKDRAERSYAVAVRVKPGILMPVDDAAFDKVKAEGTAPESALVLTARAVAIAVTSDAGAPSSIVAVELSAVDDLGLGKAFVLLGVEQREVARAPVERAGLPNGAAPQGPAEAAAWVKPVHRFSGIPVEGLTALLLDKHGNVLRRAAVVVDATARDALMAAGATPTTPAQPTTITWLSYVGAGTAFTGLVTAAGTGIALAINTQAESDDHVIDSELPLLIGFVGAVGVVIAGGVLVVVDQMPPHALGDTAGDLR